MTIQESCGCGARLVFTSNRNIAGIDVAEAQKRFHRTHKKCRVAQVANQTDATPITKQKKDSGE